MDITPIMGDTVHIRVFVYDTWYVDTGVITDMTWDLRYQAYRITINGHAYQLGRGELLTIIPPADARCRLCGTSDVALSPVRVIQHYGEDGEEDEGGCFSESSTEWRCSDRDACRRNRREWSQIMRSAAVAQDGAMREAGFGAIGNGGRCAE